ncbi:hypothetical protein [Niastella yeongjuensis]|nr:hypothetical protein [Niastella yeongjuensis]
MLYVNDEVSYDKFHKNVGQIYRLDKETTKDNGDFHYNSYTGYFQGPRFGQALRTMPGIVYTT